LLFLCSDLDQFPFPLLTFRTASKVSGMTLGNASSPFTYDPHDHALAQRLGFPPSFVRRHWRIADRAL